MGRTLSANLQAIFASGNYARRDALDIYRANNIPLHLSRGAVTRNSIVYDNYIRSVDDLSSSMEQSIDRISITCQNVNSILGFDVASDLRLLDYAIARYGKIYQSYRNPALIEDIPLVFAGVVANAEADEQNVKFELIVDYESMGAIIASRGLSPLSWWTYKNGIESTSTSNLPNSPTRAGYKERGREYEHGGWEFFEEPVSTPPGSGEYNPPDPCFLGENRLLTPEGEIPLREARVRFERDGCLKHYSFNPETGEVFEDEVDKFFVHETVGYFDFVFDDGTVINPTKGHPFFVELNKFVAADNLERGKCVKALLNQNEWFDSRIIKIKWNSDKPATVYNLKSRRFPTYFVNRRGVHNRKRDPEF